MSNSSGLRLAWRLGWRYSTVRSTSLLVAFLSRLSMLGLILGVSLLVVVLSVMNGFDREMRERILGLVPHATLYGAGSDIDWQRINAELAAHPEVLSWSRFASFNGMLIRGRTVEPTLMYAVDPARESQVSRLADYMTLSLLPGERANIALGKPLAQRLGVDVGDRIVLAAPRIGDQRISVGMEPVHIVAVVDTGTELDQRLVLMDLATMARLPIAQPGIGLKLALRDVFNAPEISWQLMTTMPEPVEVSDWTRQFGNMYQAIQMSRRLVVIMLLSVVSVAVFNVVATLVMVVNDKRTDIAILRSQGATPRQVLLTFLIYGGIIGVVGTVLGGVLGSLLALNIADLVAWLEAALGIDFLSSDVYPVSELPSDLRWRDVVLVCGTAAGIALLTTLYPAWRASKVAPAAALRFG